MDALRKINFNISWKKLVGQDGTVWFYFCRWLHHAKYCFRFGIVSIFFFCYFFKPIITGISRLNMCAYKWVHPFSRITVNPISLLGKFEDFRIFKMGEAVTLERYRLPIVTSLFCIRKISSQHRGITTFFKNQVKRKIKKVNIWFWIKISDNYIEKILGQIGSNLQNIKNNHRVRVPHRTDYFLRKMLFY